MANEHPRKRRVRLNATQVLTPAPVEDPILRSLFDHLAIFARTLSEREADLLECIVRSSMDPVERMRGVDPAGLLDDDEQTELRALEAEEPEP